MEKPGYVCFLFWNTWLYNLLRVLIWGDITALLHLILFACITECINNNTVLKRKNSDNPMVTVTGEEHEGGIQKLPKYLNVKHKNCDIQIITAIGKELEEHIQKLHESSSVKYKNSDNQILAVMGKDHELHIKTSSESSSVKYKNSDNQILAVIGKEHKGSIQKLSESSNVKKMENNNKLAENEVGVKFVKQMKLRSDPIKSLSRDVLDTGSVELIKELIIDLQAPYNKNSKWVFRRSKYEC